MQPGVENPIGHEGWGYLSALGTTGFVPAALAIVVLPVLILVRRTRYPKWFALVNPGVIYFGCSVFQYAPAPVGGYLVIGSGSLSFLVFFIASTLVLWNGGRVEDEGGGG